MKIPPALSDYDHDLLSRCLNKEVEAENELYRRLSSRMFGVCLRFGGNRVEAEDILQNGFIRLFRNLHQYRGEGAFEAWSRKIFVNAAIDYYHRQLKFSQEVSLTGVNEDPPVDEEILAGLSVQDLLALIRQLPVGYRTVFNLFVIDRYQHKEIAGLLGISEGTSKSQLSRAKALIRTMLKRYEKQ